MAARVSSWARPCALAGWLCAGAVLGAAAGCGPLFLSSVSCVSSDPLYAQTGASPALIAACNGQTGALKLLIEAQADVNKAVNVSGLGLCVCACLHVITCAVRACVCVCAWVCAFSNAYECKCVYLHAQHSTCAVLAFHMGLCVLRIWISTCKHTTAPASALDPLSLISYPLCCRMAEDLSLWLVWGETNTRKRRWRQC